MYWNNAEQYPDYTAWEAMLRASSRFPDGPDTLDDRGCMLLICAIVRQAVEDHDRAVRLLPRPFAQKQVSETEAFLDSFFHSGFFRCPASMGTDRILPLLRKEMTGR